MKFYNLLLCFLILISTKVNYCSESENEKTSFAYCSLVPSKEPKSELENQIAKALDEFQISRAAKFLLELYDLDMAKGIQITAQTAILHLLINESLELQPDTTIKYVIVHRDNDISNLLIPSKKLQLQHKKIIDEIEPRAPKANLFLDKSISRDEEEFEVIDLFNAIKDNDINKTRNIISFFGGTKFLNVLIGWPPLIHAIVNDNKEIFDFLFDLYNSKDVHPDVKKYIQELALYHCVGPCHPDKKLIRNHMLAKLLLNKPDVNSIVSQQGYAPLHAAAVAGNLESVLVLLKTGADIHLKTLFDKKTALELAHRALHKDVAAAINLHGTPEMI